MLSCGVSRRCEILTFSTIHRLPCDKVPEMLRAVILGLMAALAALSETPLRSIGIFVQFEAAPASQSVVAMKNEVARILKPAGFTIYWRSLEENLGAEAFSDILVVKFHGKCRIQYATTEGELTNEEYTLATTLVNAGKVLPYSDVACDQVVRLLPTAVGNRQNALGKALGRVLAHELYHLLGNVTRHAAKGIGKSTIAAIDLAAGSLRFDDATTALLAQAK